MTGSTALINIRQFRSLPGQLSVVLLGLQERAPGERSLRCTLVVLNAMQCLLAEERRQVAAAGGVAAQT